MKNDLEIEDIVEEFVCDLNVGLSNIINIFEPEVICIGGRICALCRFAFRKNYYKINKRKYHI